jgi:hypothetical protein
LVLALVRVDDDDDDDGRGVLDETTNDSCLFF